MNGRTIWIAIGLIALFAGGVATGILVQPHSNFPHGSPTNHVDHMKHGEAVARHVERFRSRLSLTDEQALRVERVLQHVHGEVIGLRKEFHQRFESIRERAWDDIRDMLTENQFDEFERLVQELELAHAHSHGHAVGERHGH